MIGIGRDFVLGMGDWIFGLSRLSWSDERAVIGWRYELPLWVWVLLVLGAIGFTWWSYRRLVGPLWSRVMLAGVRVLLLVVVAMLIAGPRLVITQEHIEPDWLLMLVDRSASMGIKDVALDGGMVSRYERMSKALIEQGEVFGDEQLGKDRRLVWLGFDGSTFEIPPVYGGEEQGFEPTGRMTSLRTAIEQGMQRAAGRPVSGIVLLSDGRSSQNTGGELIRSLQQQAVGVYSVALGSNAAPVDIAIAQVQVPRKAFVDDLVPVSVQLDLYGDVDDVDRGAVMVRLIDPLTGGVLDEKSLDRADEDGLVRLSTRPTVVGPQKWRVEVEYEVGDGGGELVTDNNSELVGVELIDRPIRVLYVEGYPRWEYRYLKNLLIREQSIDSSMMLISADQNFAQEGDQPIARLPRDAEEFGQYDVVIIGDVPAGYFSDGQLALIREQVSERGVGVLWIGGERSVPGEYGSTVLADLLPMVKPGLVRRVDTVFGELSLEPTAVAKGLQVLNVMDPQGVADGAYWPSYLPKLKWAQDVGVLKPTAEVLARSVEQVGDRQADLVVQMRYGAGQVIYVATDDTYQWRRGRGEVFFEQFWVQLVRMLGRSRVQQQERARFTLGHRQVEMGQTVVVDLRIDDVSLAERDLPKIDVAVKREDGGGTGDGSEMLQLLPVGEQQGGQYRALWRGSEAGRYEMRVVEPALDMLGLMQVMDVIHPADELRQPAPDHARLSMLSEQTGGAMVGIDEISQLTGLVPNRARRTPNDITEPLWDSPAALLLVLCLLAVEWVGRKVIRLV